MYVYLLPFSEQVRKMVCGFAFKFKTIHSKKCIKRTT